MKYGVGTWIMIPVFLILLLFPLGTFGIFRLSSDWYMSREAYKRVERSVEYVQKEAEEISGFLGDEADYQKTAAQNESVEMIKRIGKRMRKQPVHISIIAFNSRLEETYTSTSNTDTNPFSLEWKQLLEKGELIPGEITQVTLNGNPYVAELYEVKTKYQIRGKYFIVYERIADVSQLLLETGGLLMMITLFFFLISIIAAWLIAKRIETPVKELCICTQRIGNGYGELENKQYKIRELEQLRTAFVDMEKRLNESQREKEYIFQGISHDLRTPLASIIGYADGIHRGIMSDTQKASQIILEESQRMKRMVDDVLTLSKLDSNSWSDKKVLLPLEEFLEEQTEILQGMAVENGKNIVFMESEKEDEKNKTSEGFYIKKTYMVETDTELLTRIFQNVVANCLRYADHQVLIHINCLNEWIKVFVEDDGSGIEETERAHIFERDYRGKKGQFGLGLAMAKSGMEHLNGTIEVENKKLPEKGAIFCLSFPPVELERNNGNNIEKDFD